MYRKFLYSVSVQRLKRFVSGSGFIKPFIEPCKTDWLQLRSCRARVGARNQIRNHEACRRAFAMQGALRAREGCCSMSYSAQCSKCVNRMSSTIVVCIHSLHCFTQTKNIGNGVPMCTQCVRSRGNRWIAAPNWTVFQTLMIADNSTGREGQLADASQSANADFRDVAAR